MEGLSQHQQARAQHAHRQITAIKRVLRGVAAPKHLTLPEVIQWLVDTRRSAPERLKGARGQ